MTRFLLLVGTVLALSILPPALAKEKWLYAKSEHLDVLTNCSQKESIEVVAKLETFRAAVMKLIGRDGERHNPLHLIIFRNDDDLEPYKPRYKGKPSNAAAFFAGQPSDAGILMSGDNIEWENHNIILHEYTHRILDEEGLIVPSWLNEGLAEFYSTFRQESNGRCVFGDDIATHVEYLARGRLMGLDELFAANEKSATYNEDSKQGLFYAESWALIHFWLCGEPKTYQAGFSKFVSGIQAKLPVEPLFRDCFKCDYATMLRELRSYVSFSSSYMMKTIQLPVVDYAKMIQFRPATPYEISLGKIRSGWYGPHRGDTMLKLMQLKEQNPGPHPEIEELLSMVALRDHDVERVYDYWEKACEEGSTNPYILENSVRRVLDQRMIGGASSFLPEEIAEPLRVRTERALVASPQSQIAWENLILIEALVKEARISVVKRVREHLDKLPDRLLSSYAIAMVLYRANRLDACLVTCKALLDYKGTPEPLRGHCEDLARRARAKKTADAVNEEAKP